MIKVAIRVYTDTYETYYEHVFTWEQKAMLEFFGFALDFVKAYYPEGYVSVEFQINPPEEAKEETEASG